MARTSKRLRISKTKLGRNNLKKITLTLNETVFNANFEDNQTANTIIDKMPLGLDMMNLYSRELTYRFKESLPQMRPKREAMLSEILHTGHLDTVSLFSINKLER
nr:cyclophilin-like fold protein [Companilactobacillus keshanensis]